ncbi:MAG TPA: hypothetical protein VM934_18330 [Pyrinomonadaceae bacterium]|nr:hypothetical protein [Pyrinomonadaceae bacterium]
MARTETEGAAGGGTTGPPPLRRDEAGRIEPSSLADMIGWFLSYDERVAVVNFPVVEALFQWKQAEQLRADPEAFTFARAEDRLAVGIMQALTENESERELHGWIKELLGALDDATRTNEAIAAAYGLDPGEDSSPVAEAEKIPAERERSIYLTCCWLETLCTAEARVLGWAYRQLHGRPFHPENF